MLDLDEAQFLAELMNFKEKTPQEVLAEEMKARGLRNVDVGKSLGLKNPSIQVSEMLNPKHPYRFGANRQKRLARVWGLPDDHFRNSTKRAQLEVYRRHIWKHFQVTETYQRLNPHQRWAVECVWKHIPIEAPPKHAVAKKPYLDGAFLEAFGTSLLIPSQYTTEEIVFAIVENAALDEANAQDSKPVDVLLKAAPKAAPRKKKPSKRK